MRNCVINIYWGAFPRAKLKTDDRVRMNTLITLGRQCDGALCNTVLGFPFPEGWVA